MKGRLRVVPTACAPECALETTPAGCKAIVARHIDQALEELADAGEEAARRVDSTSTEKAKK